MVAHVEVAKEFSGGVAAAVRAHVEIAADDG